MKKHIGSTLESFFDELGEKEDVELLANKKLVAETLKQQMKVRAVTSTQLAALMKTSRNQVQRLLDPSETGVTFKSIDRASRALGMSFEVHFAVTDAGRPPRTARAKRAATFGSKQRRDASRAMVARSKKHPSPSGSAADKDR